MCLLITKLIFEPSKVWAFSTKTYLEQIKKSTSNCLVFFITFIYMKITLSQQFTKCSYNVILVLAHRLRHCLNINPALGEHFVLARKLHVNRPISNSSVIISFLFSFSVFSSFPVCFCYHQPLPII